MGTAESVGTVAKALVQVDIAGLDQIAAKMRTFASGMSGLGAKMTLGLTAPFAIGLGVMLKATIAEQGAMDKLNITLQQHHQYMPSIIKDLANYRTEMEKTTTVTAIQINEMLRLGFVRDLSARQVMTSVTAGIGLNYLFPQLEMERWEDMYQKFQLGTASTREVRMVSRAMALSPQTTQAEIYRQMQVRGAEGMAGEKVFAGNDVGAQFEKIRRDWTEMMGSFGSASMNPIRNILKWVDDLLLKIKALPDATKQWILEIGGVVAALGPLVLITGQLVTAWRGIASISIFKSLSGAGAIRGGAAGAGAAVEGTEAAEGAGAGAAGMGALTALPGALKILGVAIAALAIAGMGALAQKTGELSTATDDLKSKEEALKTARGTAATELAKEITADKAKIKADTEMLTNDKKASAGIKNTWTSMWDAIVTEFTGSAGKIISFGDAMIEVLDFFKDALTKLIAVVGTVVVAIEGLASELGRVVVLILQELADMGDVFYKGPLQGLREAKEDWAAGTKGIADEAVKTGKGISNLWAAASHAVKVSIAETTPGAKGAAGVDTTAADDQERKDVQKAELEAEKVRAGAMAALEIERKEALIDEIDAAKIAAINKKFDAEEMLLRHKEADDAYDAGLKEHVAAIKAGTGTWREFTARNAEAEATYHGIVDSLKRQLKDMNLDADEKKAINSQIKAAMYDLKEAYRATAYALFQAKEPEVKAGYEVTAREAARGGAPIASEQAKAQSVYADTVESLKQLAKATGEVVTNRLKLAGEDLADALRDATEKIKANYRDAMAALGNTQAAELRMKHDDIDAEIQQNRATYAARNAELQDKLELNKKDMSAVAAITAQITENNDRWKEADQAVREQYTEKQLSATSSMAQTLIRGFRGNFFADLFGIQMERQKEGIEATKLGLPADELKQYLAGLDVEEQVRINQLGNRGQWSGLTDFWKQAQSAAVKDQPMLGYARTTAEGVMQLVRLLSNQQRGQFGVAGTGMAQMFGNQLDGSLMPLGSG